MWIYTLFPQILNMSITASIVIVFVLLARLLLKKTPKAFSYALWAVVLFRLLCPVSISSNLSLLNVFDAPFSEAGSVEYIPTDIVHTENPQVTIPVPGISEAINENLPQGEEQLGADPLETPMAVATFVWLIGMGALLLHSIISLIKLRRKLIGAVHLRHNVYLADHITSPFVMGLLRPKIYLPSTLTEQEQTYIIQHEQHHIRRFDPIIKILAFASLCVHWFNPLVWLAFVLSGKDMEMSCDEAVMKAMDSDIRAEYSTSLLSLATGRKNFAGTPLAFGEGDTRSRIKNVMKYKKPILLVSACTFFVVVIIGIGFITNPKVNRHFSMTGNSLSDLQPLEITQSIGKIIGKDFSEIYLTPDNFGLTVSTDFSYVDSEAIRFLYDISDENCKAAQLRIFPDEEEFFITEPNNNWVAPNEQIFKLHAYLEALKYLPQEEISAICNAPPQRYAIELSKNDKKYNDGRQIFYNNDGVMEKSDWLIRLDIQPLYGTDNGVFNGLGNDTIHVYYIASEKPDMDYFPKDNLGVETAEGDLPLSETHDLSQDGEISTTSAEASNFEFTTNSEQVKIEISNAITDVLIELYSVDDKSDAIQRFTLNSSKPSDIFTNLTASKTYCITVTSNDDINLVISD